MSRDHSYPAHGQLGYLQVPALDVAASLRFYQQVFGWQGDLDHGSFEAPGVIGQWTTERAPSADSGVLLWLWVDELGVALARVGDHGGRVLAQPQLDQGERWLAEIEDPAGNRIGIVAAAGAPQSQTMITVRDVEASSQWYQELLGLRSDHGGREYERLLADGALVLQLHHEGTAHHHGLIGEPGRDRGNGVLLWFGEVADFDAVVARAERLGAPVVREPHRNPPTGQGNGPGHREVWLRDPDGYTVVVASADGEAFEPNGSGPGTESEAQPAR
jgi:predicted enzyme related to lactoylglutathione lyase